MRLGTFRLTRHRAVRAVTGLVAAFLLSGHVLAAAGMCAMRAPATPGGAAEVFVEEASDVPCAEHLVEESAPGPAVATHHCPTDDPSAQSRSVDVPAAQLMAVATAIVPNWTSPALQAAPLLADHQPSETQPLYTRLQRLRL